MKFTSISLNADILNETENPDHPSDSKTLTSFTIFFITYMSISAIRPAVSANGINTPGLTKPFSVGHRINASKEVALLCLRFSLGW